MRANMTSNLLHTLVTASSAVNVPLDDQAIRDLRKELRDLDPQEERGFQELLDLHRNPATWELTDDDDEAASRCESVPVTGICARSFTALARTRQVMNLAAVQDSPAFEASLNVAVMQNCWPCVRLVLAKAGKEAKGPAGTS